MPIECPFTRSWSIPGFWCPGRSWNNSPREMETPHNCDVNLIIELAQSFWKTWHASSYYYYILQYTFVDIWVHPSLFLSFPSCALEVEPQTAWCLLSGGNCEIWVLGHCSLRTSDQAHHRQRPLMYPSAMPLSHELALNWPSLASSVTNCKNNLSHNLYSLPRFTSLYFEHVWWWFLLSGFGVKICLNTKEIKLCTKCTSNGYTCF